MNHKDSTDAYGLILEKFEEIERSLDHIDISSIKAFSLDIDKMLAKIINDDRHRSSLMTATQQSTIEMILEKNELITGRIQGITAIQRSELNQLKLGIKTARGYSSQQPARTGSIVNSSN
jgi:hypothetical protein